MNVIENNKDLGSFRHNVDFTLWSLYNILDVVRFPDDIKCKFDELLDLLESYSGSYSVRIEPDDKTGEPQTVYEA